METDEDTVIVETVTALFIRNNLTLVDPPLVSIECTANCRRAIIITDGPLIINVSCEWPTECAFYA